jgi:hypothetical protein
LKPELKRSVHNNFRINSKNQALNADSIHQQESRLHMTGEPMNRREFVADGVAALAAASTIVPSRLVNAPAAEISAAKGRTLTNGSETFSRHL